MLQVDPVSDLQSVGHFDSPPLPVNHLSLHPVELPWTPQLSERDSYVKIWVQFEWMITEAGGDTPETDSKNKQVEIKVPKRHSAFLKLDTWFYT